MSRPTDAYWAAYLASAVCHTIIDVGPHTPTGRYLSDTLDEYLKAAPAETRRMLNQRMKEAA